jgi:hypothetical protein
LETKRIPPLEGWLIDIDMSKGTIRSSEMPAFVHADTLAPTRQARDFHSARGATTVENSYPATSQSQQLYKSLKFGTASISRLLAM